MKQITAIDNPTFDFPDYEPGAFDYMTQAHMDEMYTCVHFFRQQCPAFGLQEMYALNSFYVKRHP